MEPDELREFWRLADHEIIRTAGAEALLEAVLKEDRSFRRTIILRDAREIGASIAAAVLYLVIGWSLVPGSKVILVAACLILLPGWFMVVDRIMQRRWERGSAVPLRDALKGSIDDVCHQALLLRTVLWWYLAPPGVAYVIVLARVLLVKPFYSRWSIPVFSGMMVIGAVVGYAVWRLNQRAVATELMPRKLRLETILRDLNADGAAENTGS